MDDSEHRPSCGSKYELIVSSPGHPPRNVGGTNCDGRSATSVNVIGQLLLLLLVQDHKNPMQKFKMV